MPLFPGTPRFPGDPPFVVTPVRSLDRGDAYGLSSLTFGSHAGTHIDPPAHFLPGGASVGDLDLEVLNGPCRVVAVDPTAAEIGAAEVARVPRGTRRVLFRTANSARWAKSLRFFPDYVGMTVDGAEVLLHRGVALVGIDSLSVENDPTDRFPVHRRLLTGGTLILEGLLLDGVHEGAYRLECLPLRLREGDGGPARATLIAR